MHTPEEVISHPEFIPETISRLNAKRPEEKYGAAKLLMAVSENAPDLLYPEFEFFTGLLASSNTILKWNAIRILGNLARVDSGRKLEPILDKYLAPIRGPVMITAGNVIKGAAAIASAKPELAGRIANAILGVSRARYATPECRNIALGHAIAAFDLFFEKIEDKAAVLRLVRKQLKNTRPAVRKKAQAFLGKHAAGATHKAKAAAA